MQYREHWAELAQLCDERKVAEFWRRYVAYLTDTGCVSDERRVLCQMAATTADRLEAVERRERLIELTKKFLRKTTPEY